MFNSLGTKSFRVPSTRVIDGMLASADKDKDGKINFEEFVTLMLEQDEW